MSYDPSRPEGFSPDRPEGGLPYEPAGYDPYAARSVEAVRRRVQMPAIFLIVVSVINILFLIYQSINLVVVIATPAEQLYTSQMEMFEKIFPGMAKGLTQTPPEQFKSQEVVSSSIFTAVLALCSLLILLGAIQMLRLRSYGLAVTASILAAIPCVTCSACCGLGEGVGIWALIVLMNPEVRAAFGAMR